MSSSDHHKRPGGVTLRAVLLALAIVPFNSYWIYMSESILYTGFPTCMSIFYNAVTILLLLVGYNALIGRIAPKAVFSQGEMITVYVMVALASVPASVDVLQDLIPGMIYPQFFGTSSDGWSQQFLSRLPSWLTVHGRNVAKGFVAGGGSLYERNIILAWLLPAAVWTLFLVTLVFVMACLTVLTRKQWTENEKLTYPLVQLPLEMTSEQTSLFRSRVLWAGLLLAVALDLTQGLRALYPAIPDLGLRSTDLQTFLVTRPWNAAGWWPLYVYPFVIGLGILMPIDLLFSTWFFYIFTKAQLVGSAMFGYNQIPKFPYLYEQMFGSLMGIFVFAVWTGRRYWLSMLKSIYSDAKTTGDGQDGLRHRTAAAGAIIGALALFLFARALGMSPLLIVAFFAIFFAMCIAMTRMRAELGAPVHDFYGIGPDTMLPAMLGTASLGTGNLAALTMMYWFNRAYRSLAMPIQLEAFKMSERTSISHRKLFGAMMLAVAAGTVAAFWSELHVAYKIGAYAQGVVPKYFGVEPYNRLSNWMNSPKGPNASIISAVGVGFAFTLMLNAARMRLGWFPFHPAGYALSGNWSMNLLWFSLFIAWMLKLVILRYGGMKLYKAVFPFFLGLILGEFVMGSFWSLYSVATGLWTYNIFPY